MSPSRPSVEAPVESTRPNPGAAKHRGTIDVARIAVHALRPLHVARNAVIGQHGRTTWGRGRLDAHETRWRAPHGRDRPVERYGLARAGAKDVPGINAIAARARVCDGGARRGGCRLRRGAIVGRKLGTARRVGLPRTGLALPNVTTRGPGGSSVTAGARVRTRLTRCGLGRWASRHRRSDVLRGCVRRRTRRAIRTCARTAATRYGLQGYEERQQGVADAQEHSEMLSDVRVGRSALHRRPPLCRRVCAIPSDPPSNNCPRVTWARDALRRLRASCTQWPRPQRRPR